MNYTAGDVMDDASVLLNDAQQSLFDYTVQLPFLRMVMRDLEQQLQLSGFQLNFISEEVVDVLEGDTTVTYPDNFFMPIKLMERQADTEDSFVPMVEKRDINQLGISELGSCLTYWDWRHNCLNVLGATEDREVRIAYWRFLEEIIDEDSISDVRGGRNILSYFTAAMCSNYITRDKERARDLNEQGGIALDTFLSNVTKNNQGKRVRRKPFQVNRQTPYILARIP